MRGVIRIYMANEEKSIREIVLNSKPINLYGYTTIAFVVSLVLGIAYSWLDKESLPGVMQVVAITCVVPILSYLFRFYLSRNNANLRKRIEEAPSDNEAFSLIMGGYRYGFSILAIMAAAFYMSLKALVL